ncbi:hypothetical protein TREMEDRAFT_66365 [Tremella mesenterica DSM 1558]|uniref:uncharacterized protein n=1 Tax=Tremella mesenterica (strain ATCC 24925 / CBS 8224 / DSM 1558 / NBRC 9311 / NRRL Y-6157 / RJB 2259-6 / UBC 559-6) TaxID=578456 RepID=UPI00032D3D47|nr:uncharacterized protein TREMEDRAFT_66365 [Tremella mesenterica DSM 1558]EIW65641.1 hypothetical protein TREMEDRAFT_66365 [Tremella mesenterica DSM 1558]
MSVDITTSTHSSAGLMFTLFGSLVCLNQVISNLKAQVTALKELGEGMFGRHEDKSEVDTNNELEMKKDVEQIVDEACWEGSQEMELLNVDGYSMYMCMEIMSSRGSVGGVK